MGVITRLEHFDYNVAQKFLRKDGWIDFQNTDAQEEQFKNYFTSPVKRVTDVLDGPMHGENIISPYRVSGLSRGGDEPGAREAPNYRNINTPSGGGVRYSTFRENERGSVLRSNRLEVSEPPPPQTNQDRGSPDPQHDNEHFSGFAQVDEAEEYAEGSDRHGGDRQHPR